MKHTFSILTAVFAVLAFLVSCGGSEGTGSGGSEYSGGNGSGGIYGHVTDFATGEDVANANVQLRPGGDTTLTGSDGMFEFQNLASGDYSITVSKAGYTDLIDDFVITVKDRMVRRDVQLKKESATLRIVDDAGNDIDELDFGGKVDDVSRSFNIFNDSSASIDWEIIKTAEWIKSISKESGNLGAGNTLGIIVNIDRSLLRDGENLTKLHVTSNNGNKQLAIKATNFDSCRNNPCGHGTCKSTGTETYECKCDDGYEINSKNTCADIDECADPELNKCPEHSDCANEDGTFSCVCHEGYSGNNCVPNKRTKVCEDLPENAKWNKVEEVEQTWNGEEWTPSTQGTYNEEPSEKECRYRCNSGYIWEDNKCINKKTSKCTGLLENSHWNVVSKIEQSWNGHEWVPPLEGTYNEEPSSDECRFVCNTNYTWKGSSCEPDSKKTACTDLPENATWNIATSISQTWNGVEWLPSAVGTYNEEESMSECHFICKPNYTWKGATCESNTRTAECEGLPTGASWTTTPLSVLQTWNGTEWIPSNQAVYDTGENTDACKFRCNTNYTWKDSQCEADTQTANCTGLPANAAWNTATSITQTWNGSSWQPSSIGSYNTVSSAAECRFKCDANYIWNNSECELGKQTADCTGLPANASWNSVSSIEQTWNGEEWVPSPTGTYNTAESTSECRFKCNTNYSWKNSKCEADTKTANCTGLPSTGASWNSVSSITQTWNGSSWQPSTSGSYNTTASTTECRFKCNTNYSWKNSKCEADTKTANCTGLPATGASWNSVSSITQTWNGSSWQPTTSGSYNTTSSTTECRFKCNTNYSWKNSTCEADTKTASCTGLPTNASWNSVSSIEQTWNGEEWVPSPTGTYNTAESTSECRFKCNTNYSWKNSKCEADTRTANCTGLPATGASWNSVSSITQTWNGSSWQPTTSGSYNTTSSTSECRYKCADSYHTENSGATCISNTKTGVSCTGLIANAQWNLVSSITQTWSSTNGWQPSTTGVYSETASTNECKYKCDSTHYWYNSECTSPCDYEPCEEVANSTGCTATSWRDYSCGCNSGYTWNRIKCVKQAFGNICTGQNKCYGSVSELTCPTSSTANFFGQDAYYANLGECIPQNFTVQTFSNQKVVLDNNTGLMWQQTIPTETYSWGNAVSYCDNSTYAGYSDWRLPTVQELLTIVDSSRYDPAAINTTYFPDTQPDRFWSSTTHAMGSTGAWYVHFARGYVDNCSTTTPVYVRCVR